MGVTRRGKVDPTDEWEQIAPLCRWPEQLAYEEIRPMVLFRYPAAERSEETGSSERTLYRKVTRFGEEGMESLFDSASARRSRLPPVVRRMIVELKAEYPRFSLGEIATVCYVRTGRRPGKHTVGRVLAEEPVPLRMLRRFDPYHEIPEGRERRRAVVALHAEGWTVKAIAGYMRINRDTVYETLRRWAEQGQEGLADNQGGVVGRPEALGQGPAPRR